MAALLTTEVATNAVLHARTAYRLALELVPPELTVEVHDGNEALPVKLSADPRAESGRGLALVEAMALRWGARAQTGGKAVWFVLRCPQPGIGALRTS